MTDPARSIVVLDKSIRDDEAERIFNAIRQLRGVASVEPVGGGVTAQAIADARHRPVEDAILARAEAITEKRNRSGP